jgi:hypothetical protein
LAAQQVSDNIIGGLFGLLMLCFIGFIFYLILNPKNRFAAAFDSWKKRRIVHAIGTALRAIFFLVVIAMILIGGLNYYFTESGWLPRTREIVVYAEAAKWVPGELRECFSNEGSAKDELLALECPMEFEKNADETHTLTVKFWGPITTERPKLWKCEREEKSLTCRLQ